MSELRQAREFPVRDTRQGRAAPRPPAKAIIIAFVAGTVIVAIMLALPACVPTP